MYALVWKKKCVFKTVEPKQMEVLKATSQQKFYSKWIE